MIAPIKVERIACAEELIAALRPHDDRWQPYPADWIFRGQWDSRYTLLPTAYRANAWEPFAFVGDMPFDPIAGYQSDIVQAQHEYAVLKRFLDDIDRAGIDIPSDIFVRTQFGEANNNDLEFLLNPAIATFAALAQHHGVPTRLLDWTRSGIYAAYFGAAEAAKHKDDDGRLTVWALSVAFVEHVQGIEDRTQFLQHAPHVRVITSPRAGNPNLHAQAGLFALWFNMAKIAPLEEIVLQILLVLDAHDGRQWSGPSPLHRLDLPWSEAPKLLRMLADEQVDAVRMFPGRDGVVRGMKEQRLWDRKA